jgi:hypothetical protein
MSLDYHLVDPLGDDEKDEQQSDALLLARHSECIDFGDKYMTNNELIYHYKSC